MTVTKDQIADVVEKQVARFGYQKTTVDDIAAALGISKKTLYQHFDSKRDMYEYLVRRMSVTNRAQLAASIAGLPTYRGKVDALVGMVVTMAREHIAETSEADWRGEYEVAADAYQEATGSLLEDLIERGIAAGEFAVRDAALARRMATAMILEYTLMMREVPSLDRDEEMRAGIARYLG
jgi:AcrR family transcriptional regulator